MQHNISKLPHHVWETANKVNLYSKVEVTKGDTLSDGKSSVTVTKVCDCKLPSEAHKKAKGIMFYELDVAKVLMALLIATLMSCATTKSFPTDTEKVMVTISSERKEQYAIKQGVNFYWIRYGRLVPIEKPVLSFRRL